MLANAHLEWRQSPPRPNASRLSCSRGRSGCAFSVAGQPSALASATAIFQVLVGSLLAALLAFQPALRFCPSSAPRRYLHAEQTSGRPGGRKHPGQSSVAVERAAGSISRRRQHPVPILACSAAVAARHEALPNLSLVGLPPAAHLGPRTRPVRRHPSQAKRLPSVSPLSSNVGAHKSHLQSRLPEAPSCHSCVRGRSRPVGLASWFGWHGKAGIGSRASRWPFHGRNGYMGRPRR